MRACDGGATFALIDDAHVPHCASDDSPLTNVTSLARAAASRRCGPRPDCAVRAPESDFIPEEDPERGTECRR